MITIHDPHNSNIFWDIWIEFSLKVDGEITKTTRLNNSSKTIIQ